MTDIQLAPAELSDEPFLRELHAATMRPLVEQIWGWDHSVQEGFFQQHLAAGDISIVKVAGVRVGSVQVHDDPGHTFLSQIEIAPEHQGHGYGSRVIGLLQERAKGRGARVDLQVLKVNVAALRLYQRLGFVITDETDTHHRMTWQPQL